jgi:hypothetical protein
MFSRYTSDPQSRMRLLQRCSDLANDIGRADGDQRPTIAYAALNSHRRTQRVAAGWVQTWPGKPGEDPNYYRTVGVDDDGPTRYINLGAASGDSIDPDTKLVHEVQLLHDTRDMIRLVAALSDDVGYPGSWLIGVQLNRLSGHVSQLADPFVGGRPAPAVPFDASGYSASTRASALELRDKPEAITGRLMRKLLRGLGTEWLLSQPPFDQG